MSLRETRRDLDEQHENPEQDAARSLALAEDLVPLLLSTDRRGALDRLTRNYEQYRRALAWFLGRDDVARALLRASGHG